MPLPYLHDKRGTAAVIMAKRKAEGGIAEEPDEESNESSDLEECMKAFKSALASGDTALMAKHFKDAFQIADASPHEEGEHTNDDESYDSLNEKAGSDNG